MFIQKHTVSPYATKKGEKMLAKDIIELELEQIKLVVANEIDCMEHDEVKHARKKLSEVFDRYIDVYVRRAMYRANDLEELGHIASLAKFLLCCGMMDTGRNYLADNSLANTQDDELRQFLVDGLDLTQRHAGILEYYNKVTRIPEVMQELLLRFPAITNEGGSAEYTTRIIVNNIYWSDDNFWPRAWLLVVDDSRVDDYYERRREWVTCDKSRKERESKKYATVYDEKKYKEYIKSRKSRGIEAAARRKEPKSDTLDGDAFMKQFMTYMIMMNNKLSTDTNKYMPENVDEYNINKPGVEK